MDSSFVRCKRWILFEVRDKNKTAYCFLVRAMAPTYQCSRLHACVKYEHVLRAAERHETAQKCVASSIM